MEVISPSLTKIKHTSIAPGLVSSIICIDTIGSYQLKNCTASNSQHHYAISQRP